MTLARLKDLCIDATDRDLMRDFWRLALDASVDPEATGPQLLRPGIDDAVPLWINPVPEGRSPTKARVHLDLRLGTDEPTPDRLIAAGATVLLEPREKERWWLLADPEGNEFCAFVPKPERPRPSLYELIIDARDSLAQARWWHGVLGGELEIDGQDAGLVGAAGVPFEYFVFQTVPEPKTVKNRLHWDVDLTDPTPDRLVAHGATIQRAPDGDIRWWIMLDPEGNEFCAFAP